jgi:hypothetical protein
VIAARAAGRAARAGVVAALAALGIAGAACDDGSHRDIGDEINILIRRNDALVPSATERLARYGRLAIPQIETALHTAAPAGRLHLITALEKIGDGEAVPILRHFAVYDARSDVRQAAADLLARWAAGPGDAPARERARAERARSAQARVAAKQRAGEGPLISDQGIPGAPSTVGAPAPVGSELEKPR